MTREKTMTIPSFSGASVLVYGDVMLDRYWHGNASRISPEAPVPVVNVGNIEARPGGAANVAQNIAALGAAVSLCGFVGDDEPGRELQSVLEALNVTCCFQKTLEHPTITKLRVLSAHQQLIRMDFEKVREPEMDDSALLEQYVEKLKTAQVVILSDYSKGALCHVEKVIALAKSAGVPVLIDPKHKDYHRYAGASVLTPNLKEFESVVGPCASMDVVVSKARALLEEVKIDSLLVTLGKDGMVLIRKNQEALHFHAKARDVFDVTGAGDTVIAVLAASMAAGVDIAKAVELANTAAGVVVGKLGAQGVTVADLQQAMSTKNELPSVLTQAQLTHVVTQARARGEKIVMTNGCFDILHVGHVDYLAKAKAMGDRLLVAVNDDASVSRLKGDERPFNTVMARMTLLAALGVVDWVVPFAEDTPARLIEAVMPDVLVKGGDYQIHEIAGSDAVMQNGGLVTTIPLVPGFSTSGLAEKMKKEPVL